MRSLAFALQAYLEDVKLRSEFAAAGPTVEGQMQPTPAQIQVANIDARPGLTVVRACAGSGKTTAAMGLAKRVVEGTDLRCMLSCFMKAQQEETEAKFRTLDPKYDRFNRQLGEGTLNSTAHGDIVAGNHRADGKLKLASNLMAMHVVNLLGLTDLTGPIQNPPANKSNVGKLTSTQIGNRVLRRAISFAGRPTRR